MGLGINLVFSNFVVKFACRGLELAFQRVPGVTDTSVGYTQGSVEKPTYGEVCSGSSGHTEAVQVGGWPSLRYARPGLG